MKDAFKTTSEYYSRYRVPYPKPLISSLLLDSDPPLNGTLVDLATGPGRVALALSSKFGKVVALDSEPEMIQVAKRRAAELGISNVSWLVCNAESYCIESNSVHLITIGEAFHRLDQDVILRLANQWLVLGGSIAMLGGNSVLHGESDWQFALRDAIEPWRKEESVYSLVPRGKVHDVKKLEEAGFVDVKNVEVAEQRVWTIDSILGYLHSTSRFSPKALGNNLFDFRSRLRASLEAVSTENGFQHEMLFGYSIGKKP